jgi:hypothetical protein
VVVLIAVGMNHWDWTIFPQAFVRLWVAFLAVCLTAVLISVLAALNPLWFSLGGLGLLGFLLLLASDKGSLINQYIGVWFYQAWDMNLFSAAVTVFALAIAFGGIAAERRREKP